MARSWPVGVRWRALMAVEDLQRLLARVKYFDTDQRVAYVELRNGNVVHQTRWWKRWTRRQDRRTAEERELELREFVYLDEVSVTSLLSSRLGKMPSEFTDTLTNATKAELNSSIQASAAVLKSGIGSRLESTSSEDSRIVSKATIQASFKRWYSEEKGSLALRPISPTEPVPSTEQVAKALSSANHDVELTPWVIPPWQLRRGRLAEVEVELQADPTFRASVLFRRFVEDSRPASRGSRRLTWSIRRDAARRSRYPATA